MKLPRIAVIGATGMVGRELIKILEEREFKLLSLDLYASGKSAGETIEFRGEELDVTELRSPDQIDADLVFFSAGSDISLKFVDVLCARGVICIDKSGAYRMQENVPLVVFGVNDHLVKKPYPKIIASPNCIATPLAQVLAPLKTLANIEQVVVSTYQAVSGAGQTATLELESQVRNLFNLRDVETNVFGKQIAFNLLPVIPAFSKLDGAGKTDEEVKLIEETKKILELKDLKMDATCVRVPVFNGHSMAVSIGTTSAIKVADAVDILGKTKGLMVLNDPEKDIYPTPLDASGEDVTLVGRIRPNTAVTNGLNFWISSDNLRTGAALNAVRIAETITLE